MKRDINIAKLSILPILIYKFNLNNNPSRVFFVKINYVESKMYMRMQRTENIKDNYIERLILPDFKTQYKVMVILA